MNRALACIAAFGLAMTATAFILGGVAVFAAAKRGDLFPPMHLVER